MIFTPDGHSTFLRDDGGLLTQLADNTDEKLKDPTVALKLIASGVPHAGEKPIPAHLWKSFLAQDKAYRKSIGL